MRIIFAGTTEFGIPTLEKVKTEHEFVAVITQPDRPAGRKKELSPSPIKLWAERNQILVLQPEKISDLLSVVRDLNPDLLLAAAYGQIIPRTVLEIPNHGSINLHGSLLPKYRGASPIQTAILNGDKTTGVTLFFMDEKLDHGPILSQATITINDDDNYLSLYKKLSLLSADLVVETLKNLNNIKLKPQDESLATYTKLFTLKDGKINWTDNASKVHNQIRALNPQPGTWTTLNDKSQSVKILEAETATDLGIDLPGKILKNGNKMLVKCGVGSLWIKQIQPAGKKPMPGIDFLNGLKNLETKLFM